MTILNPPTTMADLLWAKLSSLPGREPRNGEHFCEIAMSIGRGTVTDPTNDRGFIVTFEDGSVFDANQYMSNLRRPN